MQLKCFASDIVYDAMELAQAKAINSFSFRDVINTLTEQWAYCYEKIAQIDSGFYSQTIPIRERLTRLPNLLKQTVLVYAATDPVGYSRKVYREAGNNDMNSPWTYRISGNDLYCWDAPTRRVWLEFVPEPPFLTFTRNNRDYKIFDEAPINIKYVRDVESGDLLPNADPKNYEFGMFELINDDKVSIDITQLDEFIFRPRGSVDLDEQINLTDGFDLSGEDLVLESLILDHPYVFVSYRHLHRPEDYVSFIIEDLFGRFVRKRYNPFDYTGRPSNVEFLNAHYNDYTGMGVTVLDHSDGKAKELGWTPDTSIVYPSNVVVNYLRAIIAKRFASLNNSIIMGVEEALVSSQIEMSKFLARDQSAWKKINNVVGPNWADFL